MSTARSRTRLRELMTGEYKLTLVAPIYDTMSARIAESMGWQVAKLSSSTLKAVNYALPDQVKGVINVMDFADVVRRIRRVAPDISLAVDIDDAGAGAANRLSVWRTVRELEAAGISSIEIEDRYYPDRMTPGSHGSEGSYFHPLEEQVAHFKTALDAREDPNTLIIARTAAFSDRQLPGEGMLSQKEALERIGAYAATGVDGFYIPGEPKRVRQDIEAVHSVTNLPLLVLRMPPDVYKDTAFLKKNNVRLRYLGQPVLHMAARATHNSLKSLMEGGTGTDQPGEFDPERAQQDKTLALQGGTTIFLSRWDEFEKIDHKFDA